MMNLILLFENVVLVVHGLKQKYGYNETIGVRCSRLQQKDTAVVSYVYDKATFLPHQLVYGYYF